MRTVKAFIFALTFCSAVAGQQHTATPAPLPEQFEVGVHTFFDFGPPFDFYQLYVVRSAENGTKAERLIFTPAGSKCFAPAKLETSSAFLHASVRELLENKNPCTIPDKDLKRELKRCKKCSVYSGSNVRMQVKCGGGTRLIRSDILDRDMFASNPHTPANTAWTMQLIDRLNQELGPGVMERPMFPSPPDESAGKVDAQQSANAGVLADIAQGEYDALFPESEIKLAALYYETQKPAPPSPSVRLKTPLSVAPEALVVPIFPPLARMTRTEGDVIVEFEIGEDLVPKGETVLEGHPLLRAAALDAVEKWRFPASAVLQRLQATFEFSLNCHEKAAD